MENFAFEPDRLHKALLAMHERAITARIVLTLPGAPDAADVHLQLLVDLLIALRQQPTADTVALWRAPLAERSGGLWQIVLETSDEVRGLAGGFSVRFGWIAEVPQQPAQASGWLRLPCLPSLIAVQVELLADVLRALGQRHLSADDLAGWRDAVAPLVPAWFADNANSCLQVGFAPLDPVLGLAGGLDLEVGCVVGSIESHYRRWTETREGPLFGSHPDARVMDLAAELPPEVPVLDIGAGTGRNALALARRGHPVDALELTAVLAGQLAAAAEGLPVRVLSADIFDPDLALPAAHYRLIVLAEVIPSHFRSLAQLRQLLERACALLAPGGWLVFNAFVTAEGYQPDAIARELSQLYWCWFTTRAELAAALADLPLVPVSDLSAFAYEKEHLPPQAWPPTSWFIDWAKGRNLFPIPTPPLELRWLVYRR